MKRYQSLKLCFSLLDDRSEVLRKPLPCSTACASMCQGMVLRKTNSQINQVSKDEIQGLLRSPLASMDPRSAILSASSLTRLDSRESVRTDSQESLAIEVLPSSTAQKSIVAPHMQEQSAVPLALAHKEMLPKTEKPTCALPQQVVPDSRPKAKEVPDTTPPGEKDQTAVKKRNPESVLQDLKKKLEDKKLKEQKPEKPQAKKKNDESKKKEKTSKDGTKKEARGSVSENNTVKNPAKDSKKEQVTKKKREKWNKMLSQNLRMQTVMGQQLLSLPRERQKRAKWNKMLSKNLRQQTVMGQQLPSLQRERPLWICQSFTRS